MTQKTLIIAPPSGIPSGEGYQNINAYLQKPELLSSTEDFNLVNLEGITAQESSVITDKKTSTIQKFWSSLKFAFPNRLDDQVRLCLSHLVPLLKNSSPENPVEVSLFGASRGAVLLVEVLNVLLRSGLLSKTKGVSVRVFLDEPVSGNVSLTLWLDFFEFSMAARALKGGLQAFKEDNVESYVAYRSSGANDVVQKLFFKALPPPSIGHNSQGSSCQQFFDLKAGRHAPFSMNPLYDEQRDFESYEKRLLAFLSGQAFAYRIALPVKTPNRLLINGQELTATGDIVAPKGFWGGVYYFMNIPYIATFIGCTVLSSVFGLLSWTHTVSIVSMLPHWAMLQYISPVIVSIGSGASIAVLIMTALYSLRWGLNCYKNYSERALIDSLAPITETPGQHELSNDLEGVKGFPLSKGQHISTSGCTIRPDRSPPGTPRS